ncbi:MAG: DinB/UmuC family translesion DNA polymerase [Roseibacillus sp.]
MRAATLEDPQLWKSPLALTHETTSPRKQSLLTVLNPAAYQNQLHPGIPTARALARCPQLQILPASPDNEVLLREELLTLARTLSPDLELTAPDTLLLTWKKPTLPPLTHTTFPLQTALAQTPDLAHLNVLAGPNHHQAPLSLLLNGFITPGPEQNDLTQTLATWGLHTIADFTALARPDLHERLGAQAARLHDISTGQHHRLLTLYRPPKDYRQHLDLDHPLATLDSLLLLLRNLLHTLAARLQSHQRVPDTLLLTLHYENGRNYFASLRIPEPTTELEQLLRLLTTHLEGLTAPAPIVALTLDATVTKPTRSQHDLFQKALRDPNKFAHTLNQLTACLGRESIGIPQALDSHHPDRFTLHPPETLFQKNNTAEPTLSTSSFPLRRLRPPLPIQVLATPDHQPQALLDGPYPGPLTAVTGPYRLQSQWWQPDTYWTGNEWDVQLHEGPLSRLTHLPPHHWQLTGHY